MLEILSSLVVLFLSALFSMLGLGGASVYVPIFYFLGIPFSEAIVLGLAVNVVSTSIASIVFYRSKLLQKSDFKDIAWILAGIILTIPFGVWLSEALEPQILIGLFSLVLFAAAFIMLYPQKKKAKESALKEEEAGIIEGLGVGIMRASVGRGAVGSGAGLANGTLGIGGGVFLVPALIWGGTEPKKAAALSVVCTFVASILGLFGHANSGLPSLPLLSGVSAAALIGSFAGSKWLASGKVDNKTIKFAFGVILLIFALKLAMDAFSHQ